MSTGRCPSCGSTLASGSRFCHQCGSSVTAGSGSEIGERRTVSVLFADISGYTSMSEKLDPETVKTVVAAALGRLADEVVRHGGHVDKFIGDNVMALFGAPVAHEDDPLRAVRTGLAMQRAMEEINEDVRARVGHELRLCVGVNTGEVLAGAVGSSYTVVGDAVNVAARLQSAAEPGEVVVGRETYRATASQIEYDEVGGISLKGKADAVGAWRAVRVHPIERTRPLNNQVPLVGRSAELGQLEALQRESMSTGHAVVATVLGEPGVGKSRLVREFAARLSHAQTLWGASVPYGSGSAYFAVGEILKKLIGIGEHDSPDLAGEKLRAALQDERGYQALAALVGAPVTTPVAEDPAVVRSETFAAVRSALSRTARKRPLVLVLEDLHWADDGVVELVSYLAESLQAPVLIVCLARPELVERAPSLVAGDSDRAVLRLSPLSTAEVIELVSASTNEESNVATDAIIARCGGIPLFVEEMVRHLDDVGGDGLAGVPRTLQGLLVARLDLLDPDERRLLQRASVIGASFSPDDLDTADTETDNPSSIALTDRLCDKGFLRRGKEEFHFNHVLMRDAAYSLLPKAERARWHMKVAHRLEDRATLAEGTEVAVIAEHYLQAAMLAEAGYLSADEKERARAGALRHLLVAGDRAGSVSSDAAALAQYEAALSLTPSSDLLVDLSERIGDAAMRLGDATRAIDAWQRAQSMLPDTSVHRLAELDRRLGRAYLQVGARERAIERYQFGINRLLVLGPDAGLIKLFEDSALLYSEAGENMLAIYNGERALSVATQLQMVSAASRARGVFGLVLGRLGNADGARESFDTALRPAELDDNTRATLLRAYARHLRLHEGDTGAARQHLDAALELADQLGDVPLQVDIAGELAQLALDNGEWTRVAELTTTCEQLRNESGYAGRRALPLRLRAWTAAVSHDLQTSRRLFRQAFENAVGTRDAEEAVAALRGLGVVELTNGSALDAVGHLREAQGLCDARDMRSAYVDVVALLAIALTRSGQRTLATETLLDARERSGRNSLPAARAALLEAEGVLNADLGSLTEASDRWAALGHKVDADRSRSWAAALDRTDQI